MHTKCANKIWIWGEQGLDGLDFLDGGLASMGGQGSDWKVVPPFPQYYG